MGEGMGVRPLFGKDADFDESLSGLPFGWKREAAF
jgi:hypothetical protein